MAHKQFSPPHSTEAEEAVLGALIIDPAMVSRASTLLSTADFYFQKHAHIYEALLAYKLKNGGDGAVVLDVPESDPDYGEEIGCPYCG